MAQDGRRKTIRLGTATAKQAAAFKVKLEALIAGRITGSIDDETARWVAALPDDMHAKLAAVGLVSPRAQQAGGGLSIGELCEQYIASRDDVRKSTRTVYELTRQNLVGFFGADKPIREITEHDADLWRRDLARQGLAEATIRKRCGVAKQILRTAVKRRILTENPFAALKSTAIGNDSRLHFVSQADIQRVIDAAPDAEWRAIIALARYGGLRTPSETLALKWSDIDWERARVLVHSCKTEHFEGKGERVIPLFPELLPCLREVFEQAKPGSEFVITRYRQTNANLRTQLERIIHRAGLKTWPRLFQNLRSSRQTELAESHPLHVVTAWIGNSQLVAQKHYLQIRDEDYDRAAQNPAQYPAVQAGMEAESTAGISGGNRILQPVTAASKSLQGNGMRLKGLEPLTLSSVG